MRGGFMGGGLGDLFRGVGFGPGFGRRPFGSAAENCPFDSASGRLGCVAVTDHGLTIERSIAYQDNAGNVQTAFDTLTTNSVNLKVSVTGTRTRGEDFSTTVERDFAGSREPRIKPRCCAAPQLRATSSRGGATDP
jgi:hypothetical protein